MMKKNKIKPKSILIVDQKDSKQRNFVVLIVFVVIALLLYGNTIQHEYAYDDGIVISNNDFTRQGIAGIDDIFKHDSFYGEPNLRNNNLVDGGRYRPLSIATFALEYQFFKENPHVSHFINILILIFTAFLIYQLTAEYFFNDNTNKRFISVSFLTALIFLFHPIHTETVANIKGRDDLLCMLFSIAASISAFRFFSSGKKLYLLSVFISMFAALLSKENAITFVAAIPLMIYFFEKNINLKKFLILGLTLFASAALFLIIRSSVVSSLNGEVVQDLISNSFIEASTSQKYATIVLTLGLYIKLLFIPFPLTYDYYPYHIGLADWSSIAVLVSLFLWIGLLTVSIVFFRKKSILSFSILFFIITISPMSNILFPVGVLMSERFLYMPSFAFCLIAAWFFIEKLPALSGRYYQYGIGIFILYMASFSYKTISRNKVWESNLSLFSADVITSSGSIKSNYDYAITLSGEADKSKDKETKEKLYEKSLLHLKKAIQIYPKYAAALASYGDITFKYRFNVDTTIFYYEKALLLNSGLKGINNTLGTLYGQYKGDYDRAIVFFNKDIEQNNATADTYKKLSMCYLFKGDSTNAFVTTNNGLKIDPRNPELNQLQKLLKKPKIIQ